MSIAKTLKDKAIKALLGNSAIPRGLFELSQYSRLYGGIKFNSHKEHGVIVAVSDGFRYGSIVTSGTNEEELDKNIRDAILTSFEIPSAYRKEANIQRVGTGEREYALA